MKLLSYQSPTGPRSAAVRDGAYVDLNQVDASLPTSVRELLALGSEGRARAQAAAQSGATFGPEGVQLLPPIVDPQKVICVGLNYADHARESGMQPPPEPVLFCKFPTSIAAHGDAIVLPPESQEVDYEAELVVVIGRRGRRIAESEALDYVGGYCCGHDVSARDWQLRKPGGQWLMGKTFDTFAPFGPYLVTADEVPNPNQLAIELRLNGTTMQRSTTAEFIFRVEPLIAYISNVCTLLPGDLLFTGTPAGVGAARKPPVFLRPGDMAEVEIAGLGLLRNTVVAEG